MLCGSDISAGLPRVAVGESAKGVRYAMEGSSNQRPKWRMGYQQTSYAKRASCKNVEDTVLGGPETYACSAHNGAGETKRNADETYESSEKRGAT